MDNEGNNQQSALVLGVELLVDSLKHSNRETDALLEMLSSSFNRDRLSPEDFAVAIEFITKIAENYKLSISFLDSYMGKTGKFLVSMQGKDNG